MSATRLTKKGKIAAKVFKIRYKKCPYEPHHPCTAARYRVSNVLLGDTGFGIELCHTIFTRITGLKFTGTKWFKLVEVRRWCSKIYRAIQTRFINLLKQQEVPA